MLASVEQIVEGRQVRLLTAVMRQRGVEVLLLGLTAVLLRSLRRSAMTLGLRSPKFGAAEAARLLYLTCCAVCQPALKIGRKQKDCARRRVRRAKCELQRHVSEWPQQHGAENVIVQRGRAQAQAFLSSSDARLR